MEPLVDQDQASADAVQHALGGDELRDAGRERAGREPDGHQQHAAGARHAQVAVVGLQDREDDREVEIQDAQVIALNISPETGGRSDRSPHHRFCVRFGYRSGIGGSGGFNSPELMFR